MYNRLYSNGVIGTGVLSHEHKGHQEDMVARDRYHRSRVNNREVSHVGIVVVAITKEIVHKEVDVMRLGYLRRCSDSVITVIGMVTLETDVLTYIRSCVARGPRLRVQ